MGVLQRSAWQLCLNMLLDPLAGGLRYTGPLLSLTLGLSVMTSLPLYGGK